MWVEDGVPDIVVYKLNMYNTLHCTSVGMDNGL